MGWGQSFGLTSAGVRNRRCTMQAERCNMRLQLWNALLQSSHAQTLRSADACELTPRAATPEEQRHTTPHHTTPEHNTTHHMRARCVVGPHLRRHAVVQPVQQLDGRVTHPLGAVLALQVGLADGREHEAADDEIGRVPVAEVRRHQHARPRQPGAGQWMERGCGRARGGSRGQEALQRARAAGSNAVMPSRNTV